MSSSCQVNILQICNAEANLTRNNSARSFPINALIFGSEFSVIKDAREAGSSEKRQLAFEDICKILLQELR